MVNSMLNCWIKIDPNNKKSLPLKNKEVLVCTADDSIYGRYVSVSYYKNIQSYSDDPRHGTNWNGMDYHEIVSHWREIEYPND